MGFWGGALFCIQSSFCWAAAAVAMANALAWAGLGGNRARPELRPGSPATEAATDPGGTPCVTVTEWGGSCAVVECACCTGGIPP